LPARGKNYGDCSQRKIVTEDFERLDRAIELLKEPVRVDPSLDRRIMDEIESMPSPQHWRGRVRAALEWLLRGRPVRISPLGGLAVAAGIAAVVVLGRTQSGLPDEAVPAVAAVQGSAVQFVIVAPTATAVSLVGDFNDWNPAATPMQLVAENRVWSVTIPLDAGRYRYAFLVNGDTWLSDPSAPPVGDDEFGRPGSVVTIGET
jgi:hypothetical protein